MLEPNDLITLPYTPDLTQAGIAYTCHSLPDYYVRTKPGFNQLRQIVSEVAVELAFRRYLTAEDIPHGILEATPFTDPNRTDITMGGRRCNLQSYTLTKKNTIRQLRHHPEQLLQALAPIPVENIDSDHIRNEDIYVFALLTALVTTNQAELNRALAAGQQIYLINLLPKIWSNPDRLRSINKLTLKCDTSYEVTLDLGGLGPRQKYQKEQARLTPHQRVQVEQDFYTLTYLHIAPLPDGRIGIHSSKLKSTHIITPHEWGNIWVYGMEVVLLGYMKCGEFHRRATYQSFERRNLLLTCTNKKTLTVPVVELTPVPDLFRRVREWVKSRST